MCLLYFIGKNNLRALKIVFLYKFRTMKLRELKIVFREFASEEELQEEDRTLLQAARSATERAYAPYSGFKVGAALRLQSGLVVQGNNQENAAYPSGLCAERTALFYANANYPDQAVDTIAVTARNASGWMIEPVKPCGSCRQALLESESRSGKLMRILLDGQSAIYLLEGVDSLLPLNFKASDLQGHTR